MLYETFVTPEKLLYSRKPRGGGGGDGGGGHCACTYNVEEIPEGFQQYATVCSPALGSKRADSRDVFFYD